MNRAKIAITIEKRTLSRLDSLVNAHVFSTRSQAIQEAVEEKLIRLERNRLAQECAKLDPAYEQALAEEGMGTELSQWPAY